MSVEQLKLCCFDPEFKTESDDFCYRCWAVEASEWDPSYLEELEEMDSDV